MKRDGLNSACKSAKSYTLCKAHDGKVAIAFIIMFFFYFHGMEFCCMRLRIQIHSFRQFGVHTFPSYFRIHAFRIRWKPTIVFSFTVFFFVVILSSVLDVFSRSSFKICVYANVKRT